jgi:hypothetical protein
MRRKSKVRQRSMRIGAADAVGAVARERKRAAIASRCRAAGEV